LCRCPAFCFYGLDAPRALHALPTRRSSDLMLWTGVGGRTRMRAAWQAGLVLLIVVAVGLLSLRSGAAPAPLPAGAPPGVFSAGRAMAVLERVLGDERPHPVGSAANAAVRDRILAEVDQ